MPPAPRAGGICRMALGGRRVDRNRAVGTVEAHALRRTCDGRAVDVVGDRQDRRRAVCKGYGDLLDVIRNEAVDVDAGAALLRDDAATGLGVWERDALSTGAVRVRGQIEQADLIVGP